MVIWVWVAFQAVCFSATFVCVLVYNILLIVLHYNLQFLSFLDEMYINIYDCIATLYNGLRLTCCFFFIVYRNRG